MDRNKEFEKFIGEIMSAEATDIEMPHPSHVWEARAKIMERKKIVKERSTLLESFISFFRLDFKVYHVGLSLLFISAGIFYLNEPTYSSSGASDFIQYNEALSIQNTTISVNSSTMLTCIPTTVIRN